jgi:hypothetical protein
MRSATAFPVSTGFVEPLVAVEEVVGAHDGGVAPDIAAADIALVSNCDIADAVVLREIERCRKAMAAAAHDHHVVCPPGLDVAPDARPRAMAAERVSNKLQGRIPAQG